MEIENEAAQFHSGNTCFKFAVQCNSPCSTPIPIVIILVSVKCILEYRASIQRPTFACYSLVTDRISSSIQFYWGFWAYYWEFSDLRFPYTFVQGDPDLESFQSQHFHFRESTLSDLAPSLAMCLYVYITICTPPPHLSPLPYCPQNRGKSEH